MRPSPAHGPNPQASLEPPDPVGRIFSFTPEHFPRATRLRRLILDARPAIAVRRSELLAKHMRRSAGSREPVVMRRARALDHILSHLDPVVFEDELLVGSTTEHRVGCAIYPELHGGAIWPELANLDRRRAQPVAVGEHALEVLGLDVLPLFMETNIHDWAKAHYDDGGAIGLMERWVFFLVSLPNGVSHVLPDYASVVQQGLDTVARQAEQQARQARPEAAPFYEAVRICVDAVVRFAERYADHCEALADQTSDPTRRRELEAAAQALRRVPARPARTFHEALQSVWITHVALLQEGSDLAVNFGRMDQYLGPLLDEDLQQGRIDLEGALELALTFYVKVNDHTPLIPTAGRKLFGGGANDPSITLSGVTPDGEDATNIASYLFLKATELMGLREPNVDARFHTGSPDAWYQRVLEVVRRTGATPALYNDDAIMAALQAKGATVTDARNYGIIGCVEPAVCGKTYGSTGSIMLNLAAALELALWDGVHLRSNERVGPSTGRILDHETFESFWGAFVRQLEFLAGKAVAAEHAYERAHEALLPVPLLSALLDGPMERGRDVTRGAARYDISGVWVIGLADAADSLTAMKTLIYDEKRLTPQEVERALADDFEGHDKVRSLCIHRAPTYGNDDSEADAMAVRVVETVDQVYGRHRNYRGGPYHVGYWSMTTHTGLGALVGPLPSGRRRGQPLASGATPVTGAARRGPTAALCSTAKLPPEALANGVAHNHKVPASLLRQQGKAAALERLVRGFFAKGGMQLQFNVVDRQTLLAALEDPRLARELLVRVSGYTAYFGDLDPEMQREIIDRTEDVF
jgi:pyruvate formate-lyase/glycerol dehydratase family glycyl radical enzyme